MCASRSRRRRSSWELTLRSLLARGALEATTLGRPASGPPAARHGCLWVSPRPPDGWLAAGPALVLLTGQPPASHPGPATPPLSPRLARWACRRPPRPPASTAPVVRSSGPTAGKQGRVQAGSAPEWRASPGMFALFPALMPTSPHPPGQKAPRQFQTAIRLPKGSGGLRFMTAVGLGNCMACRLEHEARVEGGNPAALAGQAECSCFSGSEPPSPATTLRPPRTRARADHLGSAPQPSDPPSSSRRRSARSIR